MTVLEFPRSDPPALDIPVERQVAMFEMPVNVRAPLGVWVAVSNSIFGHGAERERALLEQFATLLMAEINVVAKNALDGT